MIYKDYSVNDICKEPFGIIYKITNSFNEKVYIGQTWQSLKNRFRIHLALNAGKNCVKLFRAFNKYGRENFQIDLILIAHTQNILDYWECYFIKQYDSIKGGYNIRNGGSRGKLSEESKRKISKANKGKFVGNKNPFFGKNHTNESRNKIAQSKIGKSSWNAGTKGVVNAWNKLPSNIRDQIKDDQRSINDIIQSFGVSRTTVKRIKNQVENQDKNLCAECGIKIWPESQRCKSCSNTLNNKNRSKINWPTDEELLSLVKEFGSYAETGRRLGLTGGHIRNRLKIRKLI